MCSPRRRRSSWASSRCAWPACSWQSVSSKSSSQRLPAPGSTRKPDQSRSEVSLFVLAGRKTRGRGLAARGSTLGYELQAPLARLLDERDEEHERNRLACDRDPEHRVIAETRSDHAADERPERAHDAFGRVGKGEPHRHVVAVAELEDDVLRTHLVAGIARTQTEEGDEQPEGRG